MDRRYPNRGPATARRRVAGVAPATRLGSVAAGNGPRMNVQIRPLGGGVGCLVMILASVVLSVVLTVVLNLLVR